jgi:hypothetical protein
MVILSATKREIGQYARSGTSFDNTRFTFTSYFLSVYETPLNVKCYSSTNTCRFNQTTNVLALRENEQVVITCEASFWKSETTYGIPAELFYRSNNEECSSNENKFVPLSTDTLGTQRVQNVQLKKDCSRAFQSSDTGSTYTCGIRYSNTPESLRNDEIDRLNIKIDVHYGPLSLVSLALSTNEFNKTVKQGMPVSIKCPFEGNPITYFWKQISGPGLNTVENAGDREYALPRTLAPGQYQYQCRAYVGGLINSPTETTTFSVQIQENRATTKKGKFFSFANYKFCF